ncbi:non-ribosomal peptide synthetase [Acanthopleuribacter pedis]|uniref:Amino acid adenylation domain-containing protein n=1 Tax=Acanthopleuribacter pedis TaxID=442870 RepID=A0A8J7U5N6_9BACT|nr:non-ribosomal peptide synthetase [Acanthopleuribacter pedis]MBO1319506.1 amino acid adenylation domain-containing protein [Acanthopleuribacter pedis]
MSDTKVTMAAGAFPAEQAVFLQALIPCGTLIQPGEPALLVQVGDQLRGIGLDTAGCLTRWLVQPGDTLTAATALAEVETEPVLAVAGSAYAALSRVVRDDGRFLEHVVCVRRNQKGEQRILVFAVPLAAVDSETAREELNRQCPPQSQIHHLVTARALPRDRDGLPHLEQLALLPVLDREHMAGLQADSGANWALLVGERPAPTTPRLHRETFVGTARRIAAPTEQPETTTEPAAVVAEGAPSIVAGPPLDSAGLPDNLTTLLRDVVREFPEQGMLFVDADHNAERLTYRELAQRAEQAAAALHALGYGVGDPVLLQCDERRDFLEALWACFLAGCLSVPVAIAPDYGVDNQVNARLAAAWQLLEGAPILTGDALREPLIAFAQRRGMDDARVITLGELGQTAVDAAWQAHLAEPEDPCLLLLTSGSTGMPKCVTHCHRSLIQRQRGTVDMLGLDRTTTSLNWLPLDHVAGIVDFHLRDMFVGADQVQVPTSHVLANPLRWPALLSQFKVAISWAPNFAYALVVDHLSRDGDHDWDLSCVRHLINAGESIVVRTACRFLSELARFGLPGDAMLPAWGMSETASGVTYTADFNLENADPEAAFMDLGDPIAGFGLRVVDERGVPVPEGTVGRFQVKGCAVMTGYYRNAAVTAESFTPDGWFKTGDLALLRDGRLFLTGREKDVIIIHGLNFYAHEIEAAVEELDGVVPSFTAACAVRDGDGVTDRLAVFFHTPLTGSARNALCRRIREHVAAQCSLFPEVLLPLEPAQIPKTGIGKIQRARLRKDYERGGFAAEQRQRDLEEGNDRTLPHWFLERIWLPTEASGAAGARGGVLILAAGISDLQRDTAARFWACLEQQGVAAVWCHGALDDENYDDANAWYADLASSAGLDRCLAQWAAHDMPPLQTVVDLRCFGDYQNDVHPDDTALLDQRLLLFQALQRNFGEQPLEVLVVTNNAVVFDTAMVPAASTDPAHAAVAALVCTANSEQAVHRYRLIDMGCDAPTVNAARLVYERHHGDRREEIAWREAQRFAAFHQRTTFADDNPYQPEQGDLLLLTGATGGVGCIVAASLRQDYDAKLILIGRRDSEDPALQKALAAIDPAGDNIHYVSLDLGAPEAAAVIRKAVDEGVRYFNRPLRGAYHLAGATHDAPLDQLRGADVAALLRAKLAGAVALREALEENACPVTLFSSITATLGGNGVGAYAAANRALEAFADNWRRQAAYPVACRAFSMWEDVGMSADFAAKSVTEARGYHLLSPEDGRLSLLAAGFSPAANLNVGLNGENAWIRPFRVPVEAQPREQLHLICTENLVVQPHDPFGTAIPVQQHLLDSLPRRDDGSIDRDALQDLLQQDDGADDTPPQGELEQKLAALFAQTLNVKKVGRTDHFFQLGGHSILAIQFLQKLRDKHGFELDAPTFLSAPTVAQLAQILEAREPGGSKTTATRQRIEPDPTKRFEPFPLTEIQQAYWIGRSASLELSDVSMHLYLEIDMDDVDADRLEQAWQAVIQRHDMLRAVIDDQGFEQVRDRVQPYRIHQTNLRDSDEADQTEALDALRGDLSHQVLSPAEWPTFDLRLVHLDERRSRLFVSIAAVHIDGGSFFLIMKEWGRRYRDAAFAPPALTLTFRDYVLALENQRLTEAYARSYAYWRAKLPEMPNAPALPYRVALGSLRNYQVNHRALRLPAARWDRIKAAAARFGISRSALALTVYNSVLQRWSRGEAHTLNVTLFNRQNLHPEVYDIAGDFTSNVLVETRRFGEDDFESAARRNQQQLWQDLEHRSVSGVTVLRELARLRRQASRALMPVVFTSALDLEMSGATSPHNAVAELGRIHYQTSQTPQVVLDCQWFEDDGDLLVMMDSIDEAFPAGLVDDLFNALEQLLTSLEQIGAWKGAPRLVPEHQLARRAVVNQTAAPLSDDLLHHGFEKQARQAPEAAAVISPSRRLSYRQLEHEANHLAERLLAAEVAVGELVAVIMHKEWHTAVATLAILKAGAAYQPIDPHWPAARRAYLLDQGRARVVLTQAALHDALALPDGVTALIVEAHPETGQARPAPPQRAAADDLAYVIFTSGSTGQPKGVAIEHAGAVNTIRDINHRFDVGPHDRVFGLSALNFDLSVYDLFGTFAAGAALVLPHHEQLRDPEHWLDLLFRHEVSLWNSVPALMDMLVTHARERGERLPQSLGTVFMSGDWIPVSLPDRIRALAPNAHVVSGGGATEASIWSITYPIETVDPAWTGIPYGKPMENQHFHVLDEHLEPTPDWVTGDLYIGGVGLAREYWRDPDKTAASFIIHPVSGERLYRTGDQGRYRDDGNIEFLGREDFQVKIQGYRIELGEIETALEQHHDINQAVVLAVGRDRHSQRLVGHIVPAEGADLDLDAVRLWLSDHLPGYMVPAAMMTHYALPLTPTGKLDRNALREKGSHVEPEHTGYQEPRTPLEEQLCALWTELLEVERVGVNDDLLQLGCNSLIAITAAARLRKQYNVEIPLTAVLGDGASVATLAREIETKQQGADSESQSETGEIQLNPDQHHQPYPLNAIQQAYWIGRRGGLELGNVAAYFYLEVDLAEIEHERLQQAWQRVIERHPMLRTVFDEDGNQRTLATVPNYDLPFHDFHRLENDAVETELAHIREAMSQQVMNPAKWPLFDFRLSLLPNRHGRLHFGLDLLVADAWSVQILFGDLERAYRNPGQPLPALDLTFRDYLLADLQRVEHEAYRRDRVWWINRLEQLPPAPQLPLEKSLGEIGEPRFERYHAVLEPAHWLSLTNDAKKRGLSPSGLVLAAFAEVLGRWSRTRRFTLNVTTFNRQQVHEQVDHVVGDFTSMNLLEIDGNGNNFAHRAKTLQEQLWQDLEHRAFGGLEVMREWARRLGRAPGALAPIVFTSLLDSYGKSGDFVPLGGDVVYATSQTPQVWLDHQVREQDGRLFLTWDIIADLLPDGLADDLFKAYHNLLIDLAENPPAWEVPYLHLLPKWQQDLCREVNNTIVDVEPHCLHDAFFKNALQHPQRPALITGETTLSYGVLAAAAQELGGRLVDQGIKAGLCVAVVMHKGWQQVAAVLGIHDAGGAYLPIDAALPQQRRDYIIANAGARAVVTTATLAGSLSFPDHVPIVVLPDAAPEVGTPRPGVSRQSPYDLAYIIYTSGSTGHPKGVALDHGAAYNTLVDINARFALTAEDRVFALSSLSFDLSVYDIFGPLTVGAALVLPEADATRAPDRWFELCQKHGVSFWNSVPALMEMLVIYCEGREQDLPERLRLVLMSGDWIPLDLPNRIRQRAPEITLWSGGGATEAAVWSILYPIDTVSAEWNSIPYGKPMRNQTFHVLNHAMEACPVWVPGDLYIGGAGLARCYWNDPQKTNAAFVLHPRTGERLYRTGDLGRYQPDGNIEFLGREDFQVKIQGHRIELGEIESALNAIEAVQSAICGALGEAGGPKRLVAWLVTEDGELPPIPELEQQLARRLPDYMIPAAWVALDHLPLTANGKLDRKALPAPDFQAGEGDEDHRPHTPLEFKLVDTWSRTLNVPTEELNLATGFFRFGGNSLLAIRMLNQLHKETGVDVSLREFFDQPTIGALSRLVSERQGGERGETGGVDLPPLTLDAEQRHQPFPLNDIQHAYWMGRQGAMELGNIAAHFYFELDLTTNDPNRTTAAWRTLIQRHDMLRCVIDDEGMQRVLPFDSLPPFEIATADYRALEPGEQRYHLENTREQLSHQVLETDKWPLFEIRLSRLDDARVRLHFSFDLLIADAWSARLLFQEFTALYADPTSVRPPLALQFRDVVTAMQHLPETELYQRSAAYWSARLGDLPAAPDLPQATDPGSITDPRFERRAGALNAQQWQRLQRLAGRLGVTPTGLVLAAYAEVLGCWSQNPAFTINVTTFNRLPLHDDIDELVGDFTSLTLLAVDHREAEDQAFGARARRLQQQLWQDLDHRHYSGIQVIRDLARRSGRAPGALMPVVFTSRLFGGEEEQPLLPANQDGSPSRVVYAVSQTPQVWLDKQVFEEDGTLAWTWDTVADLFMPGVVDHMFAAFETLLNTMADDPQIGSQTLAALTPETVLQQVAEVNNTAAELPQGLLHDGFLAQWRQKPDAPAIIDGDQSWTYDQLAKRAFQIATWLQEQGVKQEELVVVCMEKGRFQAAAALGVTLAGAAYLPMDPRWPLERRQRILDRAHTRLVLTTATWDDRLSWPDTTTHLRVDWCDPNEAPTQPPPRDTTPNRLAYVIFTSGSTGEPKGVAIEHRGAVNTCADINERFSVKAGDAVFALSQLHFDLSVYDLFGTLAAGATVVYPVDSEHPDPASWLNLLEQHRVSIWNSVPALVALLLTYCEGNGEQLPDSLRLVMLSGDWIALDTPPRLRAQLPDVTVISMGGATEGSIWSIIYPIDTLPADAVSVPYGKAMANQSMWVLDQRRQPRPHWVAGDIYIGGIGVAREYYGAPDLTRKAFFSDPDGNRLYRTGDLGRLLPDGNIEFLGRIDHQVKVGGYRIELGEIEACLLRHPGVVEAVVDAPWVDGQAGPGGTRRLVAYIVRHPEQRETPLDLDHYRAFVAHDLPEYMVPQFFLQLDHLPLTANGKLDRKALPSPQPGKGDRIHDAGRGPLEERIAELWQEVLRIDQVGRNDAFFDLGGNSLLALSLLTALRRFLHVPLTLQHLFDNLTVAKLATVVGEMRARGETLERADELPALVADPANGHQPFPLTPVQQAYWIGRMQGLAGGNIAAHAYYELERDHFDLDRFEAGFQQMIQRHEALRLVIDAGGEQRILEDPDDYAIGREDLRAHNEADLGAALWATRERMSHQVRDTTVWPIFEVRASLLPENRTRLHLSFDLLIADAWSSRILFRDLAMVMEGRGDELPQLGCSFRDYVLTQNTMRTEARFARARDYWLRRLDHLPGGPDLPVAKLPQPGDTPRFRRFQAHLPQSTWHTLSRRAQQRNLTPSGLLLAAFCEILGAWSSNPRFTLNLTTFNRTAYHPDVNELMGDFTSLTLLAVDTDFSGDRDPAFSERARRVQEQLWRDLDHREMNGVEVLREIVRRSGGDVAPRAPIVFTSRLFGGDHGEDDQRKRQAFGDVVYSVSQTPQVWLDHQVVEEDGQLSWTWDVVDGLFHEHVVEDMFAAYNRLLNQLAAEDADWSQSAADFLPAAPMPGAPTFNPPHDALLQSAFFEQAGADPDAVALVHGESRTRTKRLTNAAHQVAAALERNPVNVGDMVAVYLDTPPLQIAAMLGVLEAGAAFTVIDAHLPDPCAAAMLARSGAVAVITLPHLAARLSLGADSEAPALIFNQDWFREPIHRLNACPASASDPACLIFEAPFADPPRALRYDHGTLQHAVFSFTRLLEPLAGDRLAVTCPLGQPGSLYDIFGMLGAGVTLVLPEKPARFEPDQHHTMLEQEGVTLWRAPWDQVTAFLNRFEARRAAGEPLTPPANLRRLIVNDSPLRDSDLARWRELVPGTALTRYHAFPGSALWATCLVLEANDDVTGHVPHGFALPGMQVAVLNSRLAPCPLHVAGELVLGGPLLGRPFPETDEPNPAWLQHPDTGARLLRTGHKARIDGNGLLHLIAEPPRHLQHGGMRVAVDDVETILRNHPDVAEASLRWTSRPGTDDQLTAYLVPARGEQGTPTQEDTTLPCFDLAEDEPAPWKPAIPTVVERWSGELLGRVLACLRQIQPDGVAVPKYRYPSGGGLYPVQVYLVLADDGVPGFAAGIYQFHPAEFKLAYLSDQVPSNSPSVALHFVGLHDAVLPLYPDWGIDFCYLEAGYMNRLVAEEADQLGLSCSPVNPRIAAELATMLTWGDNERWVHGTALCTAGGSVATTETDRAVPPGLAAADSAPSFEPVTDPFARLSFKMEQRGLPRDFDSATAVALQPAAVDSITERLFAGRRSPRVYEQRAIPVAVFGSWLAALRPPASEQNDRVDATMFRFLLELKAGAVAGLPAGVYQYQPDTHQLQQVAARPRAKRNDHGPINRPIFDSAAFTLLFLADQSTPYAAWNLVDAGDLGQRLMHEGMRYHIGVCPLGGMDVANWRDLAAFSEGYQCIHFFFGGAIAEKPLALNDALAEQQKITQQMVTEQRGAAAMADGPRTLTAAEAGVNTEALQITLTERLPAFALPHQVLWVDQLPQDNSILLQEEEPKTGGASGEGTPRDALEQQIAEAAAAIFEVERIGTRDNFFELGANSLQLVQLQGTLQAQLDREVKVTDIFANPTVVTLAEALRGADQGQVAADEARDRARKRKQARGTRRRR